MPASTETAHPKYSGWSITFTEADHAYTDQIGRRYESVTTAIHRHFPEFDEQAAATRVATRDNRTEIDVLAEWARKRDEASDYGTRVHEYTEQLLRNEKPHEPTTEREAAAFACATKAASGLASLYEFLGAEVVIFDPMHCVAGTIDLLMRNRSTGAIALLDWKTNQIIRTDPFKGETGLGICAHLPNTNLTHYTLQLSTYQELCEDMELFPAGTQYERALIHIPNMQRDPIWIPVPDLKAEARAVIDDSWRRNPDGRPAFRKLLQSGLKWC